MHWVVGLIAKDLSTPFTIHQFVQKHGISYEMFHAAWASMKLVGAEHFGKAVVCDPVTYEYRWASDVPDLGVYLKWDAKYRATRTLTSNANAVVGIQQFAGKPGLAKLIVANGYDQSAAQLQHMASVI